MKVYFLASVLVFSLFSCKQPADAKDTVLAETVNSQDDFDSYGAKISPKGSLSPAEMQQQYLALKPGDSLNAKFTATVKSVCKMKGCWMTLDLPEVEEGPTIKFRDYGFFVPKDIAGREVIVEGIAFKEQVSVEEQKHLAEDAGKSPQEIAQISEPTTNLGFLADGVLIKK